MGRLALLFCVLVCAPASAAPLYSLEQSARQNQTEPQPGEHARTANPSAELPQATNTQEEIVAVPNRPTFATTAETVQRGVFEIEYGLEAASGHQNINGLLKWGVLGNLELRFANNPIVRDAGVA